MNSAQLRQIIAPTRPGATSIEETADRLRATRTATMSIQNLCRKSVIGEYLTALMRESDLLKAMYAATDEGFFRPGYPGTGHEFFLIHNIGYPAAMALMMVKVDGQSCQRSAYASRPADAAPSKQRQ